MKIVFFGTPEFAARVLAYLIDHKVDVVAVVTKPDRPKGRSGTPIATPVKQVVHDRELSIPVYQPDSISAPGAADMLPPLQADLFVVVAYGEIMKQPILDMPKMACINIHASLLPKYRGAAPIQRCIIEGEVESGITIMHMVKKMDAGDMIQTVRVAIPKEMTYGELEDALCVAGCKAIVDVIHQFEHEVPARTPQDHEKASLAPKLELEDCEIDWTKPASVIHNLVRGVNPHPGAWCQVEVRGEKKRLKILRTHVVEGKGLPGEQITGDKNKLIIACGEQAISLDLVQLEGKKAMPAEELLRGIPKDCFLFSKQV